MTFAKAGATVFVTDVVEDDGATTVEQIQDAGGQATFTPLRDQRGRLDSVAHRRRAARPARHLVNNAGVSGTAEADVMSTSFFDKLVDINARGAFLGIRHASPVIAAPGGGSIVNLSSVMGSHGAAASRLHDLRER